MLKRIEKSMEEVDDEAFKKMEAIDYENATKSSPLERIAASLEYLCMIMSQEGKQ